MRLLRARVAAFLGLMVLAGAAGAQGADAPVSQGADASASQGAGALENTLASDIRSVVTTGHVGAVLDLQYDEKRNLLFSAGDDGTVRIWEAADGALYRSLRVTRLSAQMMAVDPVKPRVAVVVSDGLRSFSLVVWDWEQDRQILRLPLKDAPLFLRFSGQGSYVVYGESSFESLRIRDANTGEAVPFHSPRPGMVSFAEVSRSEKTIMTYQVSGGISYWDIASGSLTLEVPTVPYLSHVRISRDRRYIVGSTGKEVVLVDALSGAVRGRAAVSGDASVDISPEEDRVAAAPGAGGPLLQWGVGPDAFVALPASGMAGSGTNSAQFQAVCYGSDNLYAAATDGSIVRLSEAGSVSIFSQNALADVTGMDARNGRLAEASRDWVRVFTSDFLEGEQSPSFVHSVLLDNPWKTPVGLFFVSDTSLLAWTRDDATPRFAVVDLADPVFSRGTAPSPEKPRFRMLPSGFRSPVSRLSVLGSSFLGIETGGTVRLVDAATGASRFESRVSALSCVVAVSPGELIGGKNTALASGGSLVRINTRTGETVSVPGRNVFTWDLAFDPSPPGGAGPVLYSLGVDASGATNLLRHDGPGFEKETVIESEPEEDLDATLALDLSKHVLYASLGRGRILAWDGSTTAEIPTDYGILRRLTPCAGRILFLDRDSILSFAEEGSGSRLAELSLFSDGEWAATLESGGYLASPGGDAHVRVFVNGSAVSAPEDYRLRIESW